jgi:hypothetical protein
MSQPERLENYLSTRQSITPLQAWSELGIYRLASCVHILKKKGRKINVELVKVSNQFGESCRVAQYRLVE